MRQTLFTIPEKLTLADGVEIPIFGFGLLLALWAIVCGGILFYQSRKNGFGAETLGFLPVMLLVGGVVAFVLPRLATAMAKAGDAPGIPVRGYGVMLLLAMVFGCGLAAYRARKMGLDPEIIYSLAFAMFLAGIAGARIFFVIQYWHTFIRPTAAETLGALLSVTNGGLVVYGSVIGGLLAGVGLLWYRKTPLLPVADIIAPSMVLGLALGRIGCLLNGCCWGGVCEAPYPRIQFPAGSPAYADQQMRGQLRGYKVSSNAKDQPVISEVVDGSDAARSGLEEGDRITNIQIAMHLLRQAYEQSPALRGAKIRVTTEEGVDAVLTVRASKSSETVNDLGFVILPGSGGMVSKLDDTSAAYEAGIRNTDKVRSLTLEGVQNREQLTALLAYSQGVYRLATEDGKVAKFTADPPELSLPVHPTQIYSAVNAGLLAAFLWFLYPHRRRDGEVFATLLCTYPIARILLEMIRTDVEGLGGTSITISQAVSGCFLLLGCGLWIYLSTRPTGSVLPMQTGDVTPTARGGDEPAPAAG